MKEYICIREAINIPPAWDALADNYFQQTRFLIHTEKYNPCNQRYYLLFDNGELVSAAIVYSLRLNLLTFLKIKSPIKIHIAGIPCSVSSPGIFGKTNAISDLRKYIYKNEKGLVLLLNLKEIISTKECASGKTLPTIILQNHFKNRDAYVASLRSSYRRRLKIINQNNNDLKFEIKTCSDFTEQMYQQYIRVYQRSNEKLEKLNFEFFKNLPDDFKLTVCYNNYEVIGWNITLLTRHCFYFFLGGINYDYNKTHQTYFRLLAAIIDEGIKNKVEYIDLGQTAETPKMRFGGIPSARFMEAHHSNFVLNKILKISEKLLEYKRMPGKTHSFKIQE
jgi:hypothetical protein